MAKTAKPITYREVLSLVRQLPAREQRKLTNALVRELTGFGMWADREELSDPSGYVEEIRTRATKNKTPQQVLDEEKRWRAPK